MMPIPEEGIEYTISSVDQLCNIFSPMLGKPKPWYEDICEEVGFSFILGGVCGTAFDFWKGMYDSPKGQRLSGGSKAVSKNSAFRFGPIVAAHCGVHRTFGYFMEDNICNSVFAAATTFGAIQLIRSRDTRSAARLALYGGLLFGFLETVAAFTKKAEKAKRKKKKKLSFSWEKGKGWDLNCD